MADRRQLLRVGETAAVVDAQIGHCPVERNRAFFDLHADEQTQDALAYRVHVGGTRSRAVLVNDRAAVDDEIRIGAQAARELIRGFQFRAGPSERFGRRGLGPGRRGRFARRPGNAGATEKRKREDAF
jgi:hypothetical protein